MTSKELAQQLNGMEYPLEISQAIEAQAEASGLVIVYGASDDLMEFSGAITEECGAYKGITVEVDAEGVLPLFEAIASDCDKDALRNYFAREGRTVSIEALWNKEPNYSWTYKTDIPHETFEVMVDGDHYCRGIVFSLADAVTIGKVARK